MSLSFPDAQSIKERFRLSGATVDGDYVVCFASGERILQHEAVRVPLGNALHVWISKAFCREG